MREDLPPDLPELLTSWELALRSEKKSTNTRIAYLRGVTLYLRWCEDNGHPPEITRTQVQLWTAEQVSEDRESSTIRLRQAALKAFVKWMVEEGELDADPLIGLKPPKLSTNVVRSLSDEQLGDLLKACQGPSFRDKRDTALVRLMAETGMRAGEVVALRIADVDIKSQRVIIERARGGTGRVVPISDQAAVALDRYQRARKGHGLAHTEKFFLGVSGNMGYQGLNADLKERAQMAGIEGFRLHLMRHTAASRWLARGGREADLMAIAGWSSRSMLDRYTRSTASERAIAAARELNLGDM